MKSETPRTDEAQELFQDEYGSGHYIVEANFARNLEREITEWRTVAKELAESQFASDLKFVEAMDKYKRMAAMPNDRTERRGPTASRQSCKHLTTKPSQAELNP